MRWVRRLSKIFAVLAVMLFLFVITGASDTLLFYARVARLYTQSPDSRLAMPLENLSKKAIADTWQAPRGDRTPPRRTGHLRAARNSDTFRNQRLYLQNW